MAEKMELEYEVSVTGLGEAAIAAENASRSADQASYALTGARSSASRTLPIMLMSVRSINAARLAVEQTTRAIEKMDPRAAMYGFLNMMQVVRNLHSLMILLKESTGAASAAQAILAALTGRWWLIPLAIAAGAIIYAKIKSMQEGGLVEETGLFILHKGEEIVSAREVEIQKTLETREIIVEKPEPFFPLRGETPLERSASVWPLREKVPVEEPSIIFPLRKPVEKTLETVVLSKELKEVHVPVLEPMPLSREAEKISFDAHELIPFMMEAPEVTVDLKQIVPFMKEPPKISVDLPEFKSLIREPKETRSTEPLTPLKEATEVVAPSPISWEPQRETRRVYAPPRETVSHPRHIHNIGPVFITFEKQPREGLDMDRWLRDLGPRIAQQARR